MNDFYLPRFAVEIYLQGTWRPVAWFAVLEDAALFRKWLSEMYPKETYQVKPLAAPDLLEVRVRLHGDLRNWDELPSRIYQCLFADLALVIVQGIADCIPDCREVRWNWLGSLQGHYVQPKQQ